MGKPTYTIYAGSQPVTDITNRLHDDLEEAKRLAADVSAGQPETAVTVVSKVVEPSGEWTATAATFLGGREVPWMWQVDFHGYLMDVDHVRLSQANITYVGGGSEIGPKGEIRTGIARNEVAVEAMSADEAIAAVKSALGPTAQKCSEWHAVPGPVGAKPGSVRHARPDDE